LNYTGKFDAQLPADGSVSHFHAHLHANPVSAPADAIIVPDAHLLFTGDFRRSGVDLILSKDDHELVLQNYFKGEKRAALSSPDGAHLTGDIVDALTGHQQFAQADGSASAGQVIGHVTKLTGSATAIRNGVSIILNQGDNVEKGDVVQSGSDSTLGITFIDGTVFGLSSNARMVLNEMVYDPNGSNNSSLLSLVAGTISFVAGETAKHGDMKIDTPVATMGIRGTAVLVEIDFDIPAAAQTPGVPSAKFQVLVEPDGTTGSYILFDKATLAPIATVNQAGTATVISNGNVNFLTTAPLSADVQKLITDVFTLKFTDNTNPNTKTADHPHTDTPVPGTAPLIKLADGATATLKILAVNTVDKPSSSGSGGTTHSLEHIDGPPSVAASNGSIVELIGVTGSSAIDTVSGTINFVDINVGDLPTATAKFDSFTYQNAAHNDISAKLNALQLADIAAVEAKLVLAADPGNNNNGSASWTYSIPDSAFDFLAAGETLTLTYLARVDNNFAQNDEVAFKTFTITVTRGSNDVPVITTSAPALAFTGDHEVGGFLLAANDPATGKPAPTSGTLVFKDADLTDTHSVSATLTSAVWSGGNVPPGPLAAFEAALTASVATDSTGTGSGIINWQLASLPDFLADFLPKDQSITLTYTIAVTDSQGATTTQEVTVTVTHTDPPDVAWIHPTGGLWSTGSNWETGTAPTASDDVVIPDEQVIGGTGSYAVTVDAAAAANSVTLNAENTKGGQLIVDKNVTLAIGQALALFNDGVLNNSGTVTVGGQIELLNESSLQNSGLLTLAQGGDFKDTSTVSNTIAGTIEVVGGTLNDLVGINNAGVITIDSTATLTLNAAAISGGTVTNKGVIDLTGKAVLNSGSLGNPGQINVSGTGNALDNEKVTANHALEVLGHGALLLDLGTTIANGTITVDGTAKLTLNDATISGGILNDFSTVSGVVVAGDIEVAGSSKVNGGAVLNNGNVTVEAATLTLDNVTVNGSTVTEQVTGSLVQIDGGDTLTLEGNATIQGASTAVKGAISNAGTIEVAAAAVLRNDTLTNTTGTLQIDDSQTLTLNDATISGGTINDFSPPPVGTTGSVIPGDIDIIGASTINGGAVLNQGNVTVNAKLTLDTVTVNGTAITDNASLELDNTVKLTSGATLEGASDLALGPITNNGTLEVAGAATLLDVTLTNTTATGSIIQIDDSQTLTLNGTTISGGTINDFSPPPAGATGSVIPGDIDIIGASTINGGAVLNQGNVTVNAKLTLYTVTGNGAAITDNASLELDNTVKLTGGATFEGTSDLALGPITNNGTLEVAGAATLLNDTLTNTTATGSIIQIDDSQTLTLNDATISGGTINDFSPPPIGATGSVIPGDIDVIGASTLNGGAVLNQGNVTVAKDVTLTLDNVTVNATTFKDTASGATLSVNVNDTLTLQGGALLTGGGLVHAGTVQIETRATLSGVTVSGDGVLNVDQGNTSASAAVPATLTLDGTTSITGGTISIGSAGTIDVIGTTTISGAAITNVGTIEANGGTLSIDPDTSAASFTNTGTLEAINGGTLVLNGETVTNVVTAPITAVASNGTVQVGSGSTLDLVSASISGGTLGNFGQINVSSTGNALHNENVSANNVLEVLSSGALLLDMGTTVANGTITIDDNARLTLNGATISGGTVNDGTASGTGTPAAFGVIEVAGSSTLNGGAVLNHGSVTIEKNITLTLDDVTVTGTAFGDTASGAIIQIDGGSTLTLNGAAVTGGQLVFGDASDTFAVTSGGATLDGVGVTGGGSLDVGTTTMTGVILMLDDGTTIKGGTLTNFGTVDIESASGATLDGVSVGNIFGTIQVDGAELPTTVTLVVEDGTTITGGKLSIGSFGVLDVELGAGILTAGTPDATLDGVKVVNRGNIHVGTAIVTADPTLLLDDGTTITGGALHIGGSGQVYVQNNGAPFGAKLDGVHVTNDGSLEIGAPTVAGSTLILDGGTTISGGTLTLRQAGDVVDVETKSHGFDPSKPDATLDGVKVNNTGTIEVAGAVTLLVNDGTAIAGGKLSIGSFGVLDVELGAGILAAGAPDATLNNVLVSSADLTSTITVGNGAMLTLNGATIEGGTINDFSPAVGTGSVIAGDIDVTGSSALNGGVVLNKGNVTVNAQLTLDSVTVNGSTITDKSSLELDDTVILKGGATLEGVSATALGPITNNGTLEVAGAATLLDATLSNASATGSILQIDSGDTLMLEGTATIQGASATVKGAISNAGTIEVAGAATLLDVMLTNTTATGSILQIDDGDTLTLNGTTISGGTINDFSPPPVGATGSVGDIDIIGSSTLNGGVVLNNGNLTIEDNQTLTLNGATIHGTTLSLDSGSTLAIEHDTNGSGATLDGVTVNNSGTVQVDAPLAPTSTLMLDDGTTVTGGVLYIGDSGEVYVQNNGAPFGATLDGVHVTNEGSLEIGTPTVAGSTLVLDGGTTISGGTLTLRQAGDVVDVETNGHGLDPSKPDATLDGVTVNNTGTIDVGLPTSGAILALDGTTSITGGTISIGSAGTIDVIGTTTISGATVTNFGTIEANGGTLSIDPGSFAASFTNTGTLEAVSGGTLVLDGQTVTNSLGDVSGTVEVVGSASVLVLKGATINGGTVTVDSGSVISGHGTIATAVTNNGSIEATGGALLDITGAITGSGSAQIDGAASLELGGSSSQSVSFNGLSATLKLDDPFHFTGDITGLAVSDVIELATASGVTVTGATLGGSILGSSVLTVTESGGHSLTFNVAGALVENDFHINNLAGGGADLLLSVDPVAEAPSLTDTSTSVTGPEGAKITLSIVPTLSADASNDPDASLSLAISNIPTDATLSNAHGDVLTADSNGNISFTAGQLAAGVLDGLSITPTSADEPNFNLHVTATTTDGTGATASTAFTSQDIQVNVTPVAEAPSLADTMTTVSVTEGGTAALTIVDTLSESQTIDSDSKLDSITITGVPTGVMLSAGASVTNADGTTTWTLTPANLTGLNVIVPDGDQTSFKLHVAATTNDGGNISPPTLADIAVNVTPVVVAQDDAISNASAPSGAGWVLDTDNGHYYRLVTTQLSWDDAKTAAQADGAYLATITSQAEQDFVTPLAVGNRAWLGGEATDDATGTGHFSWLTGPEAGTAFDFTHWRPGEPNGGFGAIEAVHIEGVDDSANGGWNDAANTAGGRDFLEEWGGLSGQIAFREGTGTTIATSVLLANDTDLNHQSLTVTSVGDQSGHSLHGGTVSLDGNIISYAPTANFSGADSFTYTVSDGSHTSTATVNFGVASTAPVIATDQLSVAQNADGTHTISGVQVSDPDPASSTETFTVTATSGAPGTSVTPPIDSGSLSQINLDLATTGITYQPGATPPPTDKVTLTVASNFGASDTVNFIFNEANPPATTPVVLTGTAGKDVIFGTGFGDVLTGGGGQDQFVFKPTSGPMIAQHSITDFVSGLDKIDVRQFTSFSATDQALATETLQKGNDTLITLDNTDTLLLKNVVATHLHAADFIVHI
jgi:hypothetical protein